MVLCISFSWTICKRNHFYIIFFYKYSIDLSIHESHFWLTFNIVSYKNIYKHTFILLKSLLIKNNYYLFQKNPNQTSPKPQAKWHPKTITTPLPTPTLTPSIHIKSYLVSIIMFLSHIKVSYTRCYPCNGLAACYFVGNND